MLKLIYFNYILNDMAALIVLVVFLRHCYPGYSYHTACTIYLDIKINTHNKVEILSTNNITDIL